MKPRTPGFWLIVATVGLLALQPMKGFSQSMPPAKPKTPEMTPQEVSRFKDTKALAEKGEAQAQLNLGYCYSMGLGVAEDKAEAVKWWRKAADQGFAEAQSTLGMCYCLGTGGLGKNNMIEAVKWWRKAADQGYAVAQSNLGMCYDDGTGVARDYVEAYAFYKLAEKTNEEAGKRLATLEKFLSHEATLRGQKRSKEIQKEIDAKIAAKKAEDIKQAGK